MLRKIAVKSTAAVLVFALSCAVFTTASSEIKVNATAQSELEDLISQIEAENKEIDNKINSIEGDISENKEYQDLVYQKLVSTKEQIDYYNNLLYYKEEEIANKEDEIKTLENKILSTEEEISVKEKNIETLDKENEENLVKFGQIIRALYISGSNDVMSVLADSTDFYDLLVRSKLMANITKSNKQFMDELQASIDEIEEMISKLETQKKQLELDKEALIKQKNELDLQREALEAERGEVQEMSRKYNADYDKYSAIIDDFEGRQEALEAERAANKKEIEEYERQIQIMIQQAQQGSTTVYDDGTWLYPVNPRFTYITTYFGYDPWRDGNHSGIDIGDAGINGTNIYASKSGVVVVAKHTYIQGYSYGKYVVIDHGSGYSTLYGHCSELYVNKGDYVNQGDIIAAVGSTGWSTGPHLHFEVRIDGVAKDPFDYIDLP